MGEVYRAVDTRLGRTVAIKIVSDDWRRRPELQARFKIEAEAIAALAHPNICQLFDVGHEGGVEFLVMELVTGESLAARLARGPLPIDRTLAYATALAAALGHAHRQGIVHRDVKPSNVILTDAGPKLLDFGLARICERPPTAMQTGSTVAASSDPLTASGVALGTWQYMAPEQLRGERVDVRTDVFALGAVIYEMLAGRRAFDFPTHPELVTAILTADPPDLRVANPRVPVAITEILRTCLTKDPDDRWLDARDLERAFEVLELATGARRVVLEGARWARFVPPAHLVFARAGRLFAAPFDPVRRQITGDPVLLASDVAMDGFSVHAAVADAGSLAYVPASLPPESTRRIVWIKRKGEVEPVLNEPGFFLSPRVSPHGRRVAFIEQRPTNTLWVYELDRATPTRVAATGDVMSPAWLPDSRMLLYSRSSQAQDDLALTAIDSSLDRSLFRSPEPLDPESVSPDGSLAITTRFSPTTRSDLWVIPLNSPDKGWPLLQSPAEENGARISPDGKWYAYTSNEAGLGRWEVYVRPFPGPGGRHQISTAGGNAVTWAQSGREIFYRERDRLMAVDIRLGSTFSAGPPKPLFTLSGRYVDGFDVSPDGQRFLLVQDIEKSVSQVNVVLNWLGGSAHHPPAR
jgi:hypothetical protein